MNARLLNNQDSPRFEAAPRNEGFARLGCKRGGASRAGRSQAEPGNEKNRPGFSLLEILIVIVLVSVVAASVIPLMSPSLDIELESAGEVVASQLDYARHLAVTHSSTYRVQFNLADDSLTLTHTGTNASLDALPATPLWQRTASSTARVFRLGELHAVDVPVHITAVRTLGTPQQAVSDIEFTPLGATTRSETTVIWLTAGDHLAQRYLPVSINPVTGLATVGDLQNNPPSTLGESVGDLDAGETTTSSSSDDDDAQ